MEEPYYLANFKHVLNAVWRRGSGWWRDHEIALVDRFTKLSPEYQAPYVKWIQRKGVAFLCEKKHLVPALIRQRLNKEGLISQVVTAKNASDVLRHLPISDLRRWLQMPGARKEEIVAAMEENWTTLQPHIEECSWVVVQGKDLFRRLFCLYFGNAAQDLSEFVKVHLGRLNYPSYSLSAGSKFKSRAGLDAYVNWFQLSTELRADIDVEQAELIIQEANHQFESDRPFTKPLLWCWLFALKSLEKQVGDAKAIDLYVACFGRSSSVKALERLTLLQERLGLLSDAYKNLSDSKDIFARRGEQLRFLERMKRVERKLGLNINRRFGVRTPQDQSISADKASERAAVKAEFIWNDEALHIEPWVLNYYRAKGYAGVIAENAYIQSLVGFLAWDVIYADCEGAFYHAYQSGPNDLGTPGFCQRRHAIWTHWTASIINMTREQRITYFCRTLAKHAHENSRLTRFADATNEVFLCWINHLDGSQLIRLVGQVLDEYQSLRSGFPDLVVWNEQEFMVIEVKGPGDRVQEPQRIWHDFLLELGVNVQIVRVRAK